MTSNDDFEIIQSYTPKKEKFTIYFIETHLSSEDTTIKVKLDSNDSSLENLFKINSLSKYYGKDLYIINIYKCSFNPNLVDKKKIKFNNDINTVEIKITLTQNKCKFDSINTINIEKDNFLGVLTFSEYKWYIMKYQPPKRIEISNTQIMKYFINSLLEKDNKNKNEACFIELMNYGVNLLRKNFENNYDYELFVLIYINSFYTENGQLIKDALDLFEIDKAFINNTVFIEEYLSEIDKIYQNQYEYLEKLGIKSEEKYLVRFYTVYIYFLYKLKQDEKLLSNLYSLMNNNKYDKFILAKLYLSKFFPFFKELTIPEDIKSLLENSFINNSKTYNELLKSFSLISDFTNKNFVRILLNIKNNYDKIHEICYKEKEFIAINDYYKQNEKDINELKTIKECLDLIFTNKKKYNYEPIKINKSTYLYFISNNYNKEFLDFIGNKLFDYFLSYEDLENVISFSSQLQNKQFIPLLKNIQKNLDKIMNVCSVLHKYIDIQNYIIERESDDLSQIKELIEYIIKSEKSSSNKFITFNIKIWLQYAHRKNLDDLFTLRKIVFLCKEVEPELDENMINLGEKIHNLGLELIRQGKLKGKKRNEFLGENEVFYTDYKLKNLEYENTQLKNKINKIEYNVNKLQNDYSDLKYEVNSLSESNGIILTRLNEMEKDIKYIKYDIYKLGLPPEK